MIVYRTIDQYDNNAGEKIGSKKIPDFEICDFTGEKISENENPNYYEIELNYDPCFGDGEGERWLYDWLKEKDKEYSIFYDDSELFSQGQYVFKEDLELGNGCEVFGKMVKKALEEMEDGIYSLEHLLRWSRGKMLEKVLKEGKYKIEDFLNE